MPMPAPAFAEKSTATPAADADKDMPEQTASLSPLNEPGPVTIQFGMEETNLPASASSPLNELATLLKVDGTLRVQLMAYASSVDGSPSSVRRKSLSRALSVREFLMDQGVQSTRIEVRALGDQIEGGAPDRVDAVVEKR
jgi:outer membrane protein OmpA-like peptidoglycan-associated protein